MNKHSTVRKQFFRYVSQNILGMIGVSAYILADTFFIAQAQGADGIAALNLVLPVYSLIFALGAMLATGAATRFALERHEGKHADGYLAEALAWAGILSVPFILLGIFSAEGIVRLLGGEPDIVTVGAPYTRIFLLFTPFFMCQLHPALLRPQRRRSVACHDRDDGIQPVQHRHGLGADVPAGNGHGGRGARNGGIPHRRHGD